MKKLFLSYRRDDVPGYVARLEDALEQAFGAERVFRDVDDIAGGAEWKRVLDQNLTQAGALILIIGPRWAEIWLARSADPLNYVAFELQRARELGVPVIPVTVNHASLPRDLDLGEVSWLRDHHFYDVSDVQNRWKSDVQGLIDTLAKLPQIGPRLDNEQHRPSAGQSGRKSTSKLIGIGVAVALLGVVGFTLLQPSDETVASPQTLPQEIPEALPQATPQARPQSRPHDTPSLTFPDISGIWVSRKDGTTYVVTQRDDGTFSVNSPGYGNGEGEFSTTMPRKFSIEMHGIGHGEFSVSNSDDTAIGWLINYETKNKEYDTLQRVQ